MIGHIQQLHCGDVVGSGGDVKLRETKDHLEMHSGERKRCRMEMVRLVGRTS